MQYKIKLIVSGIIRAGQIKPHIHKHTHYTHTHTLHTHTLHTNTHYTLHTNTHYTHTHTLHTHTRYTHTHTHVLFSKYLYFLYFKIMQWHKRISFRKELTVPFVWKCTYRNYSRNIYFRVTFDTKVFVYTFIVQLFISSPKLHILNFP